MFSSSSAHLSQKDIMEIVEYQSQTRVPSPPPPQLHSGAPGGHGQKVRIYIETLFPQFRLHLVLFCRLLEVLLQRAREEEGNTRTGTEAATGPPHPTPPSSPTPTRTPGEQTNTNNDNNLHAQINQPTRCVTLQ